MIHQEFEKTKLNMRLIWIWNKSRKLISSPFFITSTVIFIVLIYLIIGPLYSMIQSAFILHPRDALYTSDIKVGEFTLYYINRTFLGQMSDFLFYKPLLNTFVIIFPMSILALIIGGVLAWIVVRTDLPGKKYISKLAIIPYMLPPWTLSLAWITLFKNRTLGGSAGILEYFGMTPPTWLSYGPIPIIIVMAFHYYPFSFLLIGNSLKEIDTRLEESAIVLGASRQVIVRKILLSLVLPGILSSWLLIISRGIGSFSTPVFLGKPVNYQVLSTSLFSNLQTGSPGVAYLIAIVMILLAVAFIYLNQKIIGTRKGYVTITGKGAKKNLVKLGKYTRPLRISIWFFIIMVVFVPILILGIETVTRVSGDYSLGNFTLHYWFGESNSQILSGEPGVFRNPEMWAALWNSLKLGIFASMFCALAGFFIGYIVVRLRGRFFSKIFDQVSFLPYLIPSIALGATYLSLFAKPQGFIPGLYGTFILLVLITSVKNLPFASRAGISGMMQLGDEIEEAGIIAGAGWFTRMKRLIMPLQRSSILSSILLPLISAMRELSLIIILITPGTQLLTTLTFQYTDYGFYSISNALLLINIFIVLILTILVQKITGADMAEGLGG